MNKIDNKNYKFKGMEKRMKCILNLNSEKLGYINDHLFLNGLV